MNDTVFSITDLAQIVLSIFKRSADAETCAIRETVLLSHKIAVGVRSLPQKTPQARINTS